MYDQHQRAFPSGFNLEQNRLQVHCKVRSEVDYRRSGLWPTAQSSHLYLPWKHPQVHNLRRCLTPSRPGYLLSGQRICHLVGYNDLLKWDWLPEKNFNRNSKYWIICFPSSSVFYLWFSFNIYCIISEFMVLMEFIAFLILRPSDFKWQFVRYNGKRTDFDFSDSERFLHPHVDVLGMISPWLNSCKS